VGEGVGELDVVVNVGAVRVGVDWLRAISHAVNEAVSRKVNARMRKRRFIR